MKIHAQNWYNKLLGGGGGVQDAWLEIHVAL